MKNIIFIFLFILKINYASASELLNYLESAYNKNPLLNSQRESFKATKENINISISKFLPDISVSGSQSNLQNRNQTDKTGAKLSDNNSNTYTESISIDQKIFQGFDGYNSFKKSQIEVEKAKFELKDIEQKTLLNSASAYYDLKFKTESKTINKDNVDLFERQVESDRSRLQKGEITLIDLSQSESSLADAIAKLITAETELATAKSNFERIVRMTPPEVIKDDYKFEIVLPKNLITALNLSKKNNPKLVLAKLDYEISEKEVNIEKGKFSPSASVNYTQSKNENDFSTTVDDADQESIKATIKWPLFKGGKNYSSLKKAKFRKEQKSLVLKDTINEVKTDTSNAWSIYKSSAGVLRSTQAAVKAAEIANEGITLEYDSGNKRTTLEVIQSRSLLLNTRINNAKAERDFVISKFKLLSVVGGLTINNLKSS